MSAALHDNVSDNIYDIATKLLDTGRDVRQLEKQLRASERSNMEKLIRIERLERRIELYVMFLYMPLCETNAF